MSISKKVTQIVDTLKANTNAKNEPIKQDVNALQGYKILLGESEFESLMNELRANNLIKGSRGGTSDSKECKLIRNHYEAFMKKLVDEGLVSRDEEYYTLTKKTRYVALDSNNDRIQPSLNMSNVDNKIRRAKEKEAQNIKQG